MWGKRPRRSVGDHVQQCCNRGHRGRNRPGPRDDKLNIVTSSDRETPSAPPWVVDVSMAVAVATVLISVVALSQVGTDHEPTLTSYLLVATFGLVLLARRYVPITVLIASVLGTFAYYGLQYPPIGVALPVAGALFSTAERGRLRWAVTGGAVVFLVSLYFRLRDDPQPVGYLLGTESVSTLALIAAAISLGHGVHARRRYIAQQRRIRELSEQQAARETELQIQVEREHISRELHDTVGHGLSVISLHAGVGREAVGEDDYTVAASLDQIRTQSSTTLGELRGMLKLLRESDRDDSRQVHSVDDIAALARDVDAAGVEVIQKVDVTSADLSAIVDSAAFRIIQESLTNVLRHSGATTVQVSVGIQDGWLNITVADNGHGASGSSSGTRSGRSSSGFGLTGMAERVRVLGGELSTWWEDGFTVTATIPARLEP